MKQYTRDYRHGHSSRQPFQRKSQLTQEEAEPVTSGSSKWIWLVALGLTIALILGFITVQHFAQNGVKSSEKAIQSSVTTTQTPNFNPQTSTAKVAQEKVVSEQKQPLVVESLPATPEQTQEEKPVHYTFYEGLAETEVIVDAVPISVALASPYYIQAGTFGSKEVAQREKNRLKSHGQDLTISVLKQDDRVYYRLRVGPFKDRLAMNKKRNELRALGVDTLLIKAKSN
ncbi:Cell division protein FtsN [Hydrogenovibrio crunogenus]|uniref:Cell division protein FtsN n=1 Tax=Hydrogenovibrio crunogenus TaxID=39765 RepID=A0A4P7NWW0_9GAMM|nr:SPOR domain-containing protein [Hydrogenovibrio crunogenus]QBZ82167.1 Cell division protein FtsN [Hydrogenovibrio crunogenus]